jgi:hypothetical protein
MDHTMELSEKRDAEKQDEEKKVEETVGQAFRPFDFTDLLTECQRLVRGGLVAFKTSIAYRE